MRILMLGDIVGKPGRRVVQQQLPDLCRELEPDFVVVNGENIAGGSGITDALYKRLLSYGVDGVTLGDHVYRQKDIASTLDSVDNLIRPANLPDKAAGRGVMTLTSRDGSKRLRVITVLGRLFMNGPAADDPYACVDRLLARHDDGVPTLIEMHAEATSEKVAMGHYVDGRVSAVVGTHTHIPTADAWVLPGGTGYISDLGMCGPYDSVLGRRKDRVVYHMTTSMPTPFDVAGDGDSTRMCGVFIELDDDGATTRIERIERAADLTRPPFAE